MHLDSHLRNCKRSTTEWPRVKLRCYSNHSPIARFRLKQLRLIRTSRMAKAKIVTEPKILKTRR